mmetsp:Transcript_1392/g.3363  ORF Transcript_1392/g.3363 Transcript_1392/m.3363 type:complete len:248 (+) Transcript_1392:492-1235(+)
MRMACACGPSKSAATTRGSSGPRHNRRLCGKRGWGRSRSFFRGRARGGAADSRSSSSPNSTPCDSRTRPTWWSIWYEHSRRRGARASRCTRASCPQGSGAAGRWSTPSRRARPRAASRPVSRSCAGKATRTARSSSCSRSGCSWPRRRSTEAGPTPPTPRSRPGTPSSTCTGSCSRACASPCAPRWRRGRFAWRARGRSSRTRCRWPSRPRTASCGATRRGRMRRRACPTRLSSACPRRAASGPSRC